MSEEMAGERRALEERGEAWRRVMREQGRERDGYVVKVDREGTRAWVTRAGSDVVLAERALPGRGA